MKLHTFFAIGLFFSSGGVTNASAAASPPPALTQRWLLLSDIHFNPFDDPALVDTLVRTPASGWGSVFAGSSAPPGTIFKDTNAALLGSALAAMKTEIPNPPVVIVAGDFLGHNYPTLFAHAEPGKGAAEYDAFVDKTIAYLAARLDQTYPRARFVIALGNNDGYCGDYESTPGDPFLAHMAAAFEPLVNRDGAAPWFAHDFAKGGFYTTSLPGSGAGGGGEAIVLNSVFWSAKFTNACGVTGSDPGNAELDWLAATLAERPHGYRWMLTHIPTGMDAYSSLTRRAPVPFMQSRYAERLTEFSVAPAAHVSTFVFGHLHHAAFAIVGAGGQSGLPGLVVPSVSPVQGNNPSFLTATIDPATGLLTDTTTFVNALPAAAWSREYDFDAAYGTTAFDTPNLLALQKRLAVDASLRATFFNYYNAESTMATVVPSTWPWYWCSQTYATDTAYAACTSGLLSDR